MSNQTKQPDRRQTARQQTILLREVLQGKVVVQDIQQQIVDFKGPEIDQRDDSPKPKRRQCASAQGRSQNTRRSRSSPAQRSKRQILTIGEHLRRPTRGRIAQLMKQTKKLDQINQVLCASLQSPLNDHVTLAALDRSGWVVQTDSSAWAYRLRYALPKLRRQLQETLSQEVPPLRIRVSPPNVAPPHSLPRRFVITDQTINLLESTAQSLPDLQLGAALRRLAQHARQRNSKD